MKIFERRRTEENFAIRAADFEKITGESGTKTGEVLDIDIDIDFVTTDFGGGDEGFGFGGDGFVELREEKLAGEKINGEQPAR